MTSRSNMANDAFMVLLGNVAVGLANLLAGMILVRHFTDKDVFATYSQSMFLAITLVAFVPLGLHRAIIFFFPRVPSQRAFAVQTSAFISVIMLIVGAGLLLLRSRISAWMNNPAIGDVIPLIFGIMWMQNFNSILQQILLATYRARTLGAFMIVYSLAYIATIVAGVRGGYGLSSILGLIVAVNGLHAVFAVFLIVRLPGDLGSVRDMTHAKEQFRYSIPLALGSFTGVIGKTIDRFVVMHLFSPSVFAVYDRGAIELPFIYQLPYSANAVLQPRLTTLFKDGKKVEFLEAWHGVVRKMALMMIPAMLFSWLAAKHLMIVVNTEAYIDSVAYFRIYLLLIPFNMTVYPAILMATGHTGRIFWITTTALAANIILNIAAVKVFSLGPLGPALSTVTVEGAKGLIFLWIIGKTLKTGFGSVFPWCELLGITLAAGAATAICFPLMMLPLSSLPLLIVSALCYGMVYLAICLSFRIVKWSEILEIRQVVGVPGK